MPRRLALGAILLLLFVSFTLAQETGEEPLPPKRPGTTKIGGAGGFTPFWLFFDVDPINAVLRNSNAATFDKGGMPLFGGQGYGYVLFMPNLRIGGLGAGGTMKSRSLDRGTSVQRDVELSIGFGGVTVDYVIPLAPRFDLAAGILLGGGGMDLKITRDDGRAKAWDDLWDEYGSTQPAQNYTRTLTGSFFVYQPTVNLEYALLRWLGFRAGLSYLGMAGGSWKLDDKYEVFGVPNNIDGNGVMINAGIFLGTFVF